MEARVATPVPHQVEGHSDPLPISPEGHPRSRDVGLLDLAVDLNELSMNDLGMLRPFELDPQVRTAFVETLAQLRKGFFVSTKRTRRQIFEENTMVSTWERLFQDLCLTSG